MSVLCFLIKNFSKNKNYDTKIAPKRLKINEKNFLAVFIEIVKKIIYNKNVYKDYVIVFCYNYPQIICGIAIKTIVNSSFSTL